MTTIDTNPLPDGRAPGRPHPYVGRPMVMATQHSKGEVVRDLFAAVGLHVISVAINTDLFGTFTPEVPRPSGAEHAALAKARAGAAAGGLPLVIASEGSFTPDPDTEAIVVQRELLVFLDTERDLTITGRAAGYAPWVRSWKVHSDADLDRLLTLVDLSRTRLIARPDRTDSSPAATSTAGITKGIDSKESLQDAIRRAAAWSPRVVVETDLRSDQSPDRHPVIRRAALDLIYRMHTACPACGQQGFGPHEHTGQAPCSHCGTATPRTTHVLHRCPHCSHEVLTAAGPTTADPSHCSACNP